MPFIVPRILVLGEPWSGSLPTEDTALAVQQALSPLKYELVIVRDEIEASQLLASADWDLIIATSLLLWGNRAVFQQPPKRIRRLALSMNPGLFDLAPANSAEVFMRNPFDSKQLIIVVRALLGRL